MVGGQDPDITKILCLVFNVDTIHTTGSDDILNSVNWRASDT